MSDAPPPTPEGAGLSAADWRAIIAKTPLLFDVASGSMAPTFLRGEKVLIRPLEHGEPRPGQVAVFFRGMLVTHRYLGGGRCRGDNTLTVDRDIPAEAWVGIVSMVSRNGVLQPVAARGRVWRSLRWLRLVLARWRHAARRSRGKPLS